MTAYSILDKYADKQGCNEASKLGICLSFIADNCDLKKFEEFLKKQADEEG